MKTLTPILLDFEIDRSLAEGAIALPKGAIAFTLAVLLGTCRSIGGTAGEWFCRETIGDRNFWCSIALQRDRKFCKLGESIAKNGITRRSILCKD